MSMPMALNGPTMSSREIAEVVESRHDNVKRTMETLKTRGLISITQTEEPQARGGKPVTVYHVNKRDSYVVVAQLSPEFTARLVDRWQELEGQVAKPAQLSRIEILQIALDSEQARIAAESERDQAIATKAQISSSREASVMGKLSAASRKMKQLERELGRNSEEATVTAVEKAMGCKYGKQGFQPLKKWCKANNIVPNKVPCPRYGEVVAWPAMAWMECYRVDLAELFGREDSA